MEIKPYNYNILVEKIVEDKESKTESGIVLVKNENKPYVRVKVVEVGEELANHPEFADIKSGDIVYVMAMAGVDVSSIKKNNLIITPDKILCKEVINDE